jgi:hypothetical protein
VRVKEAVRTNASPFPDSFSSLIIGSAFSGFFEQFPLDSLLFPVEDGRRFFIIFPFFKFPNDTFLFYHTFKAFDSLFQHLIIIDDDMRQLHHLLSRDGQDKNSRARFKIHRGSETGPLD